MRCFNIITNGKFCEIHFSKLIVEGGFTTSAQFFNSKLHKTKEVFSSKNSMKAYFSGTFLRGFW